MQGNECMKCVIMAGGRGTRIASIAKDIPKPMVKVCGKPVLEHEIESLREQGITEILITVSYLGDKIIDYFGDGSAYGVDIKYFCEKTPMGNAGALFVPEVREWLNDDFLLINADSIFCVDINRFISFHKTKGGLATIFSHPNSHPYDSGLIIADSDGKVEKWLTKEDSRPHFYENRVNAGIHILNCEVLDALQATVMTERVDLDRQILRPLAGTGKLFCYDSSEYVSDMGTPDRYEKVCRDFEKGIVKEKCLLNKQKAIFIDRDGTINKYVGFLKNINEFELLPDAAKAIKLINNSGYLAIVTTNQPVVARGDVTTDELKFIHNKMETLLGEEGSYVNAVYYCPHHPDSGYEGEIKELKIVCACRKPKPGMLISAAKDWNIDLSLSWIVGDGKNDIFAGKSAGCRTAFIGEERYGQDITGNTLYDCVKQILDESENGDIYEKMPDVVITNQKEEAAGRFHIKIKKFTKADKEYPYSFVDFKPGVVVLTLVDGMVYAINQYRPTIEKWVLELPAGAIEKGETPEQAVEREVLEETGCIVKELIPLGDTFASIGCTNERVYLYAAFCEIKEIAKYEDSEMIKPKIMTMDDFHNEVKKGNLKCATNELAWKRYLELYL